MRLFLLACLAATALGGLSPAYAHHSTANFDQSKTATVTGTVKYFAFTNPHSYFDLEVVDKAGVAREYKIFTVARVVMTRTGWETQDLKPGDKVTVTGYPDRKEPRFMYLTEVKFQSGKSWRRDQIE